MNTSARGTQKRSSFLCQSADSGVERTRAGRSVGCQDGQMNAHNNQHRTKYDLVYLPLIDVQIRRNELVRPRKIKFGYIVRALSLLKTIEITAN